MPLLAEGQGHWRESNPGKGTKYVKSFARRTVGCASRGEISGRRRETRNKEEISKSERDCNEIDRERRRKRERERERKMENRPESSEKLMKNIEIRRKKEERELKRRRAAPGGRRTAKWLNGERERRGGTSDR